MGNETSSQSGNIDKIEPAISEQGILAFTEKELLPTFTDVYQVADGTIFYYFHSFATTELFVKWRGEKIEAKLPAEQIYDLTANESALFFSTVREVKVQATFTPPDRIVITHVRDSVKDETVRNRGICIKKHDDKAFVYRAYDDPERDKILVDRPRNLVLINLKLIHCHRAIYQDPESEEANGASVSEWNERMILVKSQSTAYCGLDSSPFVYHSTKTHLFALDTQSMQFLPGLKLENVEYIDSIVSIIGGLITVVCSKKDKKYLATAQLPTGYYKPAATLKEVMPKDFESKFLKNFEPMNILGQGGFGIVFEARDKEDNCRYAVKRIILNGSDMEMNWVVREVVALATLNHSGIVSYNDSWIEHPPNGWQEQADRELMQKFALDSLCEFEYEPESSFMYIQMELCKQSLHDWIYSNKTRELARAKAWFKQIVSAVAYLHQKGKIHRDLKPSNILFSSDDKLKVSDLGLITERALRSGREIDITRTVVGTRMYMAPEQKQPHYTSKVDVFSLGLILVELCVCMTFNFAYMVFMNYQNGRPNDILKHLPEVDQFVSWLTNVDPDKRPSCEEILAHSFLA